MKNRTGTLKAKFDIVTQALILCTNSSKSPEQKVGIASNAMAKVDAIEDKSTDNEITFGLGALKTITVFGLKSDVIGHTANTALRQMMPYWAYEHGLDAFDGIPSELVDLLEQFEDASWHNNAVPRFNFIGRDNGSDPVTYGIAIGYCYDEQLNGELIFDIYRSEHGDSVTYRDDSLLEKLNLPLNGGVFGKKGDNSKKDFDTMISFINNFAVPEKHEDFLKIVAEYNDK